MRNFNRQYEGLKVLSHIEDRVSVKKFSTEPIERDRLDRILEAARKAPSAKNRQPWRFIVIENEGIRERIESAAFGQSHVGEAPAVIAICTTNVDYTMPNGQLSYPIDLTFPAAFMMIQAQEEGLGTCAVTTYDESEVKEILTVPYSMRVVMLLLVGHPEEVVMPAQRKPMEQIISYNHW